MAVTPVAISQPVWVAGNLETDLIIHGVEALRAWGREIAGAGHRSASGLIYGFLTGLDTQGAVDYGAAHGALAMTTPGDTSMATLSEVTLLVHNGGARVVR